MVKAYSRITWKNEPSTDTPLNETNLNKMDLAINVIDDRVCNMEDSVANKATLAESYAKGGTGSRQGENTDNAKYYMEQAQSAGASGIEAKSYAKGGTGSRTGEDTDNSKYYKEQAAYYASQAQSVVGIGIATTSQAGIVKPDGGSISVALDGKITANYSNENLLDNPFFSINQRGGKVAPSGTELFSDVSCTISYSVYTDRAYAPTSYNGGLRVDLADGNWAYIKSSDVAYGYVGNTYTVDRWHLLGATSSAQVISKGVRLVRNSVNLVFRQLIYDVNAILGKTVTLSVKTSTQIVSRQIQLPNTLSTFDSPDLVIANNWYADIVSNGLEFVVRIYSIADSSLDVEAIKLEVGNTSTLANDVAPNYETELIKCKTSKADSADTFSNYDMATDSLIGSHWSASASYSVGNCVIYQNALYKCIVANSNTVPTNTSCWTKTSVVDMIPRNVVTTTEPTEGATATYSIGTTIDVIEE